MAPALSRFAYMAVSRAVDRGSDAMQHARPTSLVETGADATRTKRGTPILLSMKDRVSQVSFESATAAYIDASGPLCIATCRYLFDYSLKFG